VEDDKVVISIDPLHIKNQRLINLPLEPGYRSFKRIWRQVRIDHRFIVPGKLHLQLEIHVVRLRKRALVNVVQQYLKAKLGLR
jgi:hypothetical protein